MGGHFDVLWHTLSFQSISMASHTWVLKASIILPIDFFFSFASLTLVECHSHNPSYLSDLSPVYSIQFGREVEFYFFNKSQTAAALPLFSYLALERNRSMNDVSLDWPVRSLILIFRLQPPSTPSRGLTTSNHSPAPVCIVLQKKHYKHRSLVHQSKAPAIFFSPTPCWWILHVNPSPVLREYVYEPFFLLSLHSPSPVMRQGVCVDGACIAFCCRVMMDGHSAICALLTRGCPYFSFTALEDLHLHELQCTDTWCVLRSSWSNVMELQ